jgi:hypothetical protein
MFKGHSDITLYIDDENHVSYIHFCLPLSYTMTLTVHTYSHIKIPASKFITSPRQKQLDNNRHQPQSCAVDSFTGDLIKCWAQSTLRKTHDNHPEERISYKLHNICMETSQTTHSTSNSKTNQVMVFRRIIGDNCENVTESGKYGYHCYISCFQNKFGERNTASTQALKSQI